ncbi:MAG: hypothetical protein J6L76_06405 [Clostridia bacterium]|nr:hypothetical protein [Clostridia bacterium]
MKNSIVQVYFPDRDRSYAYYNDQFELVPGDIVFVEGKLEGLQGRVESVSYNFKINLADYKRVIAKSMARVQGEFQIVDTRMVTFDPDAAPFVKMLTRFRAPDPADIQWVRGGDSKMFSLENLKDFGFTEAVLARGWEYYTEDKVVYLSIQQGEGRAIVEGSRPYVVEFTYQDGQIGNVNCECFCTDPCKHQAALIIQLKETLLFLEKNRFMDTFRNTGYVASLTKNLFAAILLSPRTGTLRIS